MKDFHLLSSWGKCKGDKEAEQTGHKDSWQVNPVAKNDQIPRQVGVCLILGKSKGRY